MATSSPLYDYSIVPFIRSIENLVHVMNKAEEHAKEKGENVEDYTQLQLYPDMKNFTFQIQRVSDSARSTVTRIAGLDADTISMPDTETTWSELKARLTKTLDILKDDTKTNAKDFEGQEEKEITLFNGKFKFTATSYLQTYAIPNFYFHLVTAYDLLRMKGVPVGKLDFLAGSQQ